MFRSQRSHRSYPRLISACLLAASLTILAACGGGDAESDAPATPEKQADLSMLTEGWNTIEPGAPTTCSDGSPFTFFVRPGNPDLVHFYLEGGGACWNGATCDVTGRPTYSPVVNETDGQAANGVFAFDRDDNPLQHIPPVACVPCEATTVASLRLRHAVSRGTSARRRDPAGASRSSLVILGSCARRWWAASRNHRPWSPCSRPRCAAS